VHLEPRTVLLDQYLLGRVLGHGGFGITYLAWDLNLETKLAVKEYLPTGVATRTSGQTTVAAYSGQSKQDFEWGLEKFLDEARVLAKFKHLAGIASVVNFFRANGTAYLVMEYLEGVTMAHQLDQAGGRIPWDRTLRLMIPVIQALKEVHHTGVLHRDISPDNVYLTQSGGVKVLDFGAARYALGQQSRNLSVILKEGYAPEEQYRTKGNQGPWTDVYATAATMYRAITGQAPTPALDRLNEDDLARPSALGVSIPADAEECLMKGLAVRAADRYQSMEDFERALTMSGKTRKLTRPLPPLPPEPPRPSPGPTPAPGPPVADQARGWWQKTPKQVSIGGAAVLALLLVWALKPSGSTGNAEAVVKPPAPPVDGGGTPPKPGPDPGPAPAPTPAPIGGDSSARPPADNASKGSAGARQGVARGEEAFGIRQFVVEPAQARPGEHVRLKWSVRGAKALAIQPGFGSLTPVDNELPVEARTTQTFTLYAEGPNGASDKRTATLTVTGSKLEPRVVSFTATPQRVKPGEKVTLAWNVADARVVDMYPQMGTVPASGQRVVAPVRTTEYTIMARPESGPVVQQTVRVEVAGDEAAGSGYAGAGAVPAPKPPPVNRDESSLIDLGGMALVIHDHEGIAGVAASGLGKIGIRRHSKDDFCEGTLLVRRNRVTFQGSAHHFDEPLTNVVEIRPNRLPVQGRPAFHIKFKNGDNYNFGATSEDAGKIVSILEKARRAATP
jgi:serine/threonine protein kinase